MARVMTLRWGCVATSSGPIASFPDELLDEGVIGRQLLQRLSGAQQVGTAVADVCDVQLSVPDERGREGRAHPP